MTMRGGKGETVDNFAWPLIAGLRQFGGHGLTATLGNQIIGPRHDRMLPVGHRRPQHANMPVFEAPCMNLASGWPRRLPKDMTVTLHYPRTGKEVMPNAQVPVGMIVDLVNMCFCVALAMRDYVHTFSAVCEYPIYFIIQHMFACKTDRR